MSLDFRSEPETLGLVLADTGTGKTTRIPLWLLDAHIPFILVEPRRVVVKTLWNYLNRRVACERLGYQIRFEKSIPDSVQGLIVTPGIFLNYLQSGFPLKPLVVILDEFHERQKELDFILAIHKQNPRFKLVILSATLQENALKSFMALRLFRVSRKVYPIQISYEDDQVLPSLADLPQRIYRGLDLHPWKVALVFLPGKREIFDVLGYLKARGNHAVLPVFGGQAIQEQEAILYGNESRVILATNLLESSITVEGVDLVVDSGLCRALSFREGREVLALEVCSDQAVTQRAGRTGRTGPGRCHRLWSKSAKLEEKTVPEILRTDLSDLCIRSHHMQIKVDYLDFLEPPHAYQWEFARHKLQELHFEALGTVKAAEYGMKLTSLAAARALQKRAPHLLGYYLFFAALAESGTARFGMKLPGHHGADTLQETLPVDWVLWKKSWGELKRSWGQDFSSWHDLLKHFLELFGVENFSDLKQSMNLNQRKEFLACLIKELPRGLFYSCSRSEWGNDFSERVTISDLDPKDFTAVYVLSFFEMETARRKRVVLGEIYWPLERKGGYRLPKTRYETGDVLVRQNRAYEKRRWFFGSVFLEEEEVFLQGSEFRQRYSQARLLEGVFSGLSEDFFYLELLKQEGGQDFETSTYLRQALENLGAESFEDLKLLDLSDLLPQSLSFEKSRLLEAYPRELCEPGGRYAMSYNLRTKTVNFAQAKGEKEPSRLLRNRFPDWRKFWEYKGRSIELR